MTGVSLRKHGDNVMRGLGLLLILLLFSPAISGQSTIEPLGIVTAAQASTSFGMGIAQTGYTQSWQFAAAAAMGAKWVRIQCSWENVEIQNAPPSNTSGGYALSSDCRAALANAKANGMKVTLNAAYGPPHHQILTVTVPQDAPVGATSFEIKFVAGMGGETFSSLNVTNDFFGPPGSGRFTAFGPYYGSLITGVTLTSPVTATITLASTLTSTLTAGTQYAVFETLYPEASTTGATDPSVVAFGNYAFYLAQQLAAYGLQGDVELYNEPPQSQFDPFDNKWANYATDSARAAAKPFPGPVNFSGPNYGFIANMQTRKMPLGVTVSWNGTSGDGSASIIGSQMFANTGVYAAQPAVVVVSDTFHPYGGPYSNPEDAMWLPSCLQASVTSGQFSVCTLAGERSGPNFVYEAFLNGRAQLTNAKYGIQRAITETNILAPTAGLMTQQARFDVRQFLGFLAMGLYPIEFFQLYDEGTPTDPNFSFVQNVSGNTYSPKPNFTAMTGLLADINTISAAPPVAYSASTLPSVTSYKGGTYNLSTVHVVGARSGASADSDLFVVWQRSVTPCVSGSCTANWMTLASPVAASATIAIPTGLVVTSVTDSVTRAAVSYTPSGQSIILRVADNPVEILTDPAGTTNTTILLGTHTLGGTHVLY